MEYLRGFTVGDLAIQRHGRAIRARLATTHPAMSHLFRKLFEGNGSFYENPKLAPIVGHEGALDCDLDAGFEFLLTAKQHPTELPSDGEPFLRFLAGFFDAEGSIYYRKKGKGGAFELSIANTNLQLLQVVGERLKRMGVSHVLRKGRIDRERSIASGISNPASSFGK